MRQPRQPRQPWQAGQPRRRRGRLVGLLVAAALGTAACTNSVAGAPAGTRIGPLTVEAATTQALVSFAEAAAVHYQGSLSTPDGAQLTVDVTGTLTSEVFGTITVDGLGATVIVLDDTLFLKAAPEFWSALAARFGVTSGDGTALGNRWVKLPTALLGIDFAEAFTPDLVGQAAGRAAGDGAGAELADGETESVGDVETIPVEVDGGTVYLAKDTPNSVVQFELDRIGSAENTTASDVSVTVSDVSPQLTQIYADLVTQATAELATAVDALTSIEQTAHRFDACGAPSCTLVVDITNPGKTAVRVHLKADWTGDNAPLGSCEAVVGPVAPGAATTMSCAIASPEWVNFYQRANSVPGEHPYGAVWAALVLADPPDLTALEDGAAATPPSADTRETEGSHAVYRISAAGTVWKYGVSANRYWREHATDQLNACLATTEAVCTFGLQTAVPSPAAGYALAAQLVASYQEENDGKCPAGQWVSCTS